MEIYKTCPHCGVKSSDYYKCDNCEKNLIEECQGIPVTIEFGYGSSLDFESYHFCCNRCCITFLEAEDAKAR